MGSQLIFQIATNIQKQMNNLQANQSQIKQISRKVKSIKKNKLALAQQIMMKQIYIK